MAPLRKYMAFYNRTQIEITAPSMYAAQRLAAVQLRVMPKNAYKIAVVLADVPVSTASL